MIRCDKNRVQYAMYKLSHIRIYRLNYIIIQLLLYILILKQ